MKAQHCVCKETVQRRPTSVPVVCELGVRFVARHGKALPFHDVLIGDIAVVFCISLVASDFGELTHSFDANYSFESEICLECQPAGKVIGRYCMS